MSRHIRRMPCWIVLSLPNSALNYSRAPGLARHLSVTSINPNQVATLKPTTTPGTGPITGVTFDNGATTKTVPGEGTWSITLTNGQPVATFTPEKDYHGTVTPQPYTVTDSNGLTAMAKLSIDINTPAVTADEHQSTTVQTAPETTSTATPATYNHGTPEATLAYTGTIVQTLTPWTAGILASGLLLLLATRRRNNAKAASGSTGMEE